MTEEDTEQYLQTALAHGEGFGWTEGYRYYVVRSGEDRWMAVFLDSYDEIRSVRTTAVLSFAAMLFCVACVYLIVTLLSRRAIDPVVRATERQKQFITDAGHELKTPITVIATSLKVLEMETGKNKWNDKAQAQTEKLRDLVNSLVTLSRMDEEESPLKFSRFPLSEAVSETAESFRDYALSNGHELQLAIAPELEYNGDEYALRQLVSILLDNAVKYAAEGTPIAFALEKNKKGVAIRTANRCENLEGQELDKLFDRFYRADKARTFDGGFGVGLSIARGIARQHHGDIFVYKKNGVIGFRVDLR